MNLDTSDLLIAWFGGGFVLCLAWAALMGQTLVGERHAAIRPTIGALAVIGLLHPVAAFGALDVACLTRTIDDPDVEVPAWAPAVLVAVVAASVVIAVALWALAVPS